jgi:hypothetical protein
MLAQETDVVQGENADHLVGLIKAAQKNDEPVKLLTPLKFPSSQSCDPVFCLLMLHFSLRCRGRSNGNSVYSNQ